MTTEGRRPSVEFKDKVPGDSGGYDIFVRPILDGLGFCFEYLPVYTSSVRRIIQSRFLELGGSHSREGRCRRHDLRRTGRTGGKGVQVVVAQESWKL